MIVILLLKSEKFITGKLQSLFIVNKIWSCSAKNTYSNMSSVIGYINHTVIKLDIF